MPDASDTMIDFRVICMLPDGRWHIVDRFAESIQAVFGTAAAEGLNPQAAYPANLARSEENGLIKRWRNRLYLADVCLGCGYLLAGLPPSTSGLCVCPECGVCNAAPFTPAGTRSFQQVCRNCRYSLSGLQHTNECEIICPECGFANRPLDPHEAIRILSSKRMVRRIVWTSLVVFVTLVMMLLAVISW